MKKSVCLNMIVKNEAHIIKETLECMKKYINYWVIADTGSTDGTQDIIKEFFKEANIPGKLVQHEWVNFGHNRSLALKECKNKADYVWIIDADDIIIGDFKFPENMTADAYSLTYGNGFTYDRKQIFSIRGLSWKYECWIHEYPVCTNKKNVICERIIGNYYVDSRRLGSRSKDPQKYQKDKLLCKRARKEDPEHEAHYCFYGGQSCMDSGDYEGGILEYRDRIKFGGWYEQVYYSYYKIATATRILKKPEAEVVKAYLDAYNFLKSRAEPLYELGLYYNEKREFDTALKYLEEGNKIPFPKDQVLFLFKDVYDWKIKFLMAAIYNIKKRYNDSLSMCDKILASKESTINNNTRDQTEKLKYANINFVKDQYIIYNQKIINVLTNIVKMKTDANNKISLLVKFNGTDFDLLENTLNSFINCCSDLSLIDHWICITNNDNYNNYNTKIAELYPFIKIINDSDCDVTSIINTLYYINMESGWTFFEKRNYIKNSLDIIEKGDKIQQVYFNKKFDNNFNINNQFSTLKYINSSNLTFRAYIDNDKMNLPYPSIISTLTFGLSDYVSVCFDTISCAQNNKIKNLNKQKPNYPEFADYIFYPNKDVLHNDIAQIAETSILDLKKIADSDPECKAFNTWGYLKNKVCDASEFINLENKFNTVDGLYVKRNKNIKIVNLVRRPDRKEETIKEFNKHNISNYEFYDAIDGKNLVVTEEIAQLFKGNRFNNRCGVVGCALSHYYLWQQLVNDTNDDYYLICEDDIVLCDNFSEHYNEIIKNFNPMKSEFDVLFLGFHMWKNVREQLKDIYWVSKNNCLIETINQKINIGGTFGYIVTKKGAQKLLDYIKVNGIKKEIDNLMKAADNVIYYNTKPFLIYSDWVDSTKSTVDSDIQKDKNTVNMNPYSDNWDYYDGVDYNNSKYKSLRDTGKLPLKELIKIGEDDSNCVAFNTLGVFKSHIDLNSLSPSKLINKQTGEGIYVKKIKRETNNHESAVSTGETPIDPNKRNVIYFKPMNDDKYLWETDWLKELLPINEYNHIQFSCDKNDLHKNNIINGSIIVSGNIEKHVSYVPNSVSDVYLIHLSDEYLKTSIDNIYPRFKHVFRNYWKDCLPANCTVFPVAYKIGFNKIKVQNNSVKNRQYMWSFAGATKLKPEREIMIKNMEEFSMNRHKHITTGWNSSNSLSTDKYKNIMSESIFIPCFIGNWNMETSRLIEALECQCIPIVQEQTNNQPFKLWNKLFDSESLPFIQIKEWTNIKDILNELTKDMDKLEQLRLDIAQWWINYKDNLRKIFNDKLTNNTYDVTIKVVNFNKWKYIHGVDSCGSDIKHIKQNISLDKLLELADQEPNCVAVNTLGYMKNKINNMMSHPNINPSVSEGLFIKF